MPNTKDRILIASIRLFNEFGVDSVRLQQIAEDTGISVGNLAYHYKNKEAILESAQEQILDEFSALVRQYLQGPSLADFDRQLGQFYLFFQTYRFYIADFFKTNPASLGDRGRWQLLVNRMLMQIRSRIDFHVRRGDFIPEPARGIYPLLAETIWTSMVFYPIHCTLKGETCTENTYKSAIWKHIHPYFAEQGISEFTAAILPLLV